MEIDKKISYLDMDQQLPQNNPLQSVTVDTTGNAVVPSQPTVDTPLDNLPPPVNSSKRNFFQPKFLAVIIFLLLAVPFLVYVVLQHQETRQRAFQGPDFAGGYYTNLCGGNTSYSCFADCNPGNGTCSPKSGADNITRRICNGNTDNCLDMPDNWSTNATSVNNPHPGCDKSVQLDVYDKNCRDGNGGWICNNDNLKGFMTWYSGACVINDPTPTPNLGCTGVTTAQVSTNNGTTWTTTNISVPRGSSFIFRPNPLIGRTAFLLTSTGLVYSQCSSDPGHGTCPNNFTIPAATAIGTTYTVQAFEFDSSWNTGRPGCEDTLTITVTAQPLPSPTHSPSPTPTPTPTATPTPTPSNIGGPVCGTSCTTNPECPTGLMCFISAGQTSGVCRNPACQTDTDCSCDIVQINPTPSPTPPVIPEVPKAGTTWPTFMLLGTGAILVILGLAVL